MKIPEQSLRGNYRVESGVPQKVLVEKSSDILPFAPGQLFKGRVAGLTDNNRILLEIDGRLLTAKSLVPLEVGSEVWLETETRGDSPLLSLAAKKGAVQDFLKLFISGIPLSSPKSQNLPDVVSFLYKTLIPPQSIEGQIIAGGVAAATSSGRSSPESVEVLAALLGKSAQMGKQLDNLVKLVNQGGGPEQNISQRDVENFVKILIKIDTELARIFQKVSSTERPDAFAGQNEAIGSDSAEQVVSPLKKDFVQTSVIRTLSSAANPFSGDNQLQRSENILSRYAKTMEKLLELRGAKGNALPQAIAVMGDKLLAHLVSVQNEIKIMIARGVAPDKAVSFGLAEKQAGPGLSGLQKELTAFFTGLNQHVGSLKQNDDALRELTGLQKELASLQEIVEQGQSAFASFAADSNESIFPSCAELERAVQDLLAVIAPKEDSFLFSRVMLVEERVFNVLTSIQENAAYILQAMTPGDNLSGGGYGRTDAKLFAIVGEIEKKVAQYLGDNDGKEGKAGEGAQVSDEKVVKLVAAHQAINSIPAQTPECDFLLFPCFFAGNTGWGEWIFSREKEADTNGKEQYKIAFYLEMSKLGPVSMQATVAGKSICGQFLLASDDRKRYLEKNLPDLKGMLMQLGYNPVILTCGVSKRNVITQLKEALEEKAAVPRFSLLDVSV